MPRGGKGKSYFSTTPVARDVKSNESKDSPEQKMDKSRYSMTMHVSEFDQKKDCKPRQNATNEKNSGDQKKWYKPKGPVIYENSDKKPKKKKSSDALTPSKGRDQKGNKPQDNISVSVENPSHGNKISTQEDTSKENSGEICNSTSQLFLGAKCKTTVQTSGSAKHQGCSTPNSPISQIWNNKARSRLPNENPRKSPSKEGSASPTQGVFYSGARFSEPPAPADLPRPPKHWVTLPLMSPDHNVDVSNQMKVLLNVPAV